MLYAMINHPFPSHHRVGPGNPFLSLFWDLNLNQGIAYQDGMPRLHLGGSLGPKDRVCARCVRFSMEGVAQTSGGSPPPRLTVTPSSVLFRNWLGDRSAAEATAALAEDPPSRTLLVTNASVVGLDVAVSHCFTSCFTATAVSSGSDDGAAGAGPPTPQNEILLSRTLAPREVMQLSVSFTPPAQAANATAPAPPTNFQDYLCLVAAPTVDEAGMRSGAPSSATTTVQVPILAVGSSWRRGVEVKSIKGLKHWPSEAQLGGAVDYFLRRWGPPPPPPSRATTTATTQADPTASSTPPASAASRDLPSRSTSTAAHAPAYGGMASASFSRGSSHGMGLGDGLISRDGDGGDGDATAAEEFALAAAEAAFGVSGAVGGHGTGASASTSAAGGGGRGEESRGANAVDGGKHLYAMDGRLFDATGAEIPAQSAAAAGAVVIALADDDDDDDDDSGGEYDANASDDAEDAVGTGIGTGGALRRKLPAGPMDTDATLGSMGGFGGASDAAGVAAPAGTPVDPAPLRVGVAPPRAMAMPHAPAAVLSPNARRVSQRQMQANWDAIEGI